MEINQKLKNRRKELNLTLEEVAQYVGVSKATVLRWESGEIANMRRDKIGKLAQILKVSPAFVMGWEDAPSVATEPARRPDAEALTVSNDEKALVTDYRKLNSTGKEKAREYVSDLSENDKYTESLSGKLSEKAIG